MDKVKKWLALLLSAALLLVVTPVAVSAAETSGTCGDNLTWVLEGDTLTISGEGEMADYRYDAPWGSLEFSKVVVEDGVTGIGTWAFARCASLTTVTLPDSVTSMGRNAFSHCAGLTSITIPDSVTVIEISTFSGCIGLTSIIIPDNVTIMEDWAFSDCTGLMSITIPDSVINIGYAALSGCESLANIVVGTANRVYTSLDGVLYNKAKTELIQCPPGKTGAFSIPDSVTGIETNAFSGCAGLTEITIPESVTYIKSGAFSGCTSLTGIIIPNSVTDIGNSAFESCTSLTSITIPDSVTSMGAWAFDGCDGLTIYGYTGSCADDYAYKSHIPFVSIGNKYTSGNVDGAGKVTTFDALLTLKAVTRQLVLNRAQTAAADVDGNGTVDIIDALIILQYAAGTIGSFPAV